MSVRVLLVDDDRAFASMASAALSREDFHVTPARSLHEARAALSRDAPDVMILDRRLPDGDGLAFLNEVKGALPQTGVIMVTAFGDIQSAVGAIQAGASDYLTKPIELGDLVLKARRISETVALKDRLQLAETQLSRRHTLIQPQSAAMRGVLDMLERIARSQRSAVLLLGDTGTGKEAMARHFHRLASGPDAPFIQVNCAALPQTMFESELFGHERGAFTDARAARRGLVESANGGTLFLDEVGELPMDLQAKMLTFLDNGHFRRLGGSVEQTSSARVVAATNRDLHAQIKAGTFREDLWFRLSVFRVDLPPLRDRREDILPLAEGTMALLARELGRKDVRLSVKARERLLRYRFPGNVRELRNILERALVLETGPELTLDVLDREMTGAAPASAVVTPPAATANHVFHVTDGPITIDDLERRYTRHVLDQLNGRRMEAARALGVSYPTFLKRVEA